MNMLKDTLNMAGALNGSSMPTSKDTLKAGERLKVNEYLVSKNEKYMLILQEDGNFVGYCNKDPFWSSESKGKGSQLIMQDDGHLILYNSEGKNTWSTKTGGNPKDDYKFVMQDDRNIVLYNSKGETIWKSDTWRSDK